MATKTDAKATKQERRANRVVTTNRRAFHEYFIVETRRGRAMSAPAQR